MNQEIVDVKKIEVDFRKKELELLGKFEEKIDSNSKKLDKIIRLVEEKK